MSTVPGVNGQSMLIILLLMFASPLDCELPRGRAALFIFASLPLGSVNAQKAFTEPMDGWVEGQCDPGRLLGGGEIGVDSYRNN